MKSFSLLLIVLLTFGSVSRAVAAAPKSGRYKGTFTIQATLIDPVTQAETKAIVKKVIPIAAVLDGTDLQIVFAEKPALPHVDDVVGKGTVMDNSLLLSIGISFTLGGSRFTAISMRGSGDVSFSPAEDPFSTADQTVKSQCTLSIVLTRVGN
jgi:hypothetical protein